MEITAGIVLAVDYMPGDTRLRGGYPPSRRRVLWGASEASCQIWKSGAGWTHLSPVGGCPGRELVWGHWFLVLVAARGVVEYLELLKLDVEVFQTPSGRLASSKPAITPRADLKHHRVRHLRASDP